MSIIRTLTVGPVTTLVDVSPSTLRQWEREGLIPKPARSADGRRQYTQENVAAIRDVAASRKRKGAAGGEAGG